MNSISGIGNRPAAIQFGRSRPPKLKTMEELLAEDDAVVNIEEPLTEDDQTLLMDTARRIANMRELLAEDDFAINITPRLILIPVPNRAFLPPPIPAPRSFIGARPVARRLEDEFNRTEDHPDIAWRPQEARAVEDNSEGAEPLQMPNREVSQAQRRLRLLDEYDGFHDFNPQNPPTALFSLNSPRLNESPFSAFSAARALRTRERQETRQDRLMPTQAQLNAAGGNARPGTPDSASDFDQQNQSD